MAWSYGVEPLLLPCVGAETRHICGLISCPVSCGLTTCQSSLASCRLTACQSNLVSCEPTVHQLSAVARWHNHPHSHVAMWPSSTAQREELAQCPSLVIHYVYAIPCNVAQCECMSPNSFQCAALRDPHKCHTHRAEKAVELKCEKTKEQKIN